MNGWIFIDKPKDITSFKVIQKLRKILKIKKIGHAGTLDPFATGILAVAVGEATKSINYFNQNKVYTFNIVFGESKDTDDITGKTIKKSNNVPVLAFTHPKDKWEGLLSDWLEEVPGVKRIVISEDYKINGKTCVVKGDNWQENISARKNPGHEMNQGLCFQYYNSEILKYIEGRIS